MPSNNHNFEPDPRSIRGPYKKSQKKYPDPQSNNRCPQLRCIVSGVVAFDRKLLKFTPRTISKCGELRPHIVVGVDFRSVECEKTTIPDNMIVIGGTCYWIGDRGFLFETNFKKRVNSTGRTPQALPTKTKNKSINQNLSPNPSPPPPPTTLRCFQKFGKKHIRSILQT